MGYAVNMYFDSESEARVLDLWNRLADEGISSVLLDIGARPHICLAVFDDMDPDDLRDELERFSRELAPIELALAAAGTFPTTEGVVFLVPTASSELIEAHRSFHRRLTGAGVISDRYYRPGAWVPHCTVATNLTTEKLPVVTNICLNSSAIGPVRLSSVGLISYRPVRELFAFRLTGALRSAVD